MVLGVVAVVLVVVLVLGTLQRKLIYFPFGDVPAPQHVGLGGTTSVTFPTADGLTLNGWFIPAEHEPAWFTVIVFNGNAGNRSFRAPLGRVLHERGIATLLFDYRGYGENPGAPTERGLVVDSRAAREYVLSRSDVDPKRLVYFGESLGSALAAGLAAEYPPAALILRSPFTSLAEVGRFHYPFLPVRWLLRDRFATIDRIAHVRCPLLIIAGDSDRIVPLAESRRLYEAASPPKRLKVVGGADHNDDALLAGTEMIDAIVQFLRGMSTSV